MAKFFGNLNAVMIASLVLVIVTVVFLGGGADAVAANSYSSIARWLHLFFGVLWIGLLYYLNFVQVPTMPSIPDEQKPAIGGHIAPKVLFYFRWAALFTVVTGLYIAMVHGYLVDALTLKEPFRLIGVGMWMALIMAANVWFIIWPNQKKVLGIVEADADAKASAAKIALMASRTNTLLSLPMFYAMVNANHG